MAKVSDIDVLPPKAMETGSESDDVAEGSSGGVRLKKGLSLMNGVAIIVGVIVGSGIFVSPSMALEKAGSKGMALIVWVLCGLLSMIGALCYSELGTMIPKSGGDYAYIGEAFGPLPAFLYMWASLFILVPTGNAITALTFALNLLKPLWPECEPPADAVCLTAAAITCLLTVMNCYNVKWVTRVQDWFTLAKVLALLLIFLASLWYLFSTDTDNLKNMMAGTKTAPADIAIAFYSGLFSYSGWNYLNFVTEELKKPYQNLPKAICISMPVVTLVYALTNTAFFAVLSNIEILAAGSAVAIAFSAKIVGWMSWIMSLFVALCTLGSLNGAIYASSRLFFVGARNGHLPLVISLIDIKRLTPVPSLIFLGLVTMGMLCYYDLQSLIVFVMAVEALFNLASVAGLIWMRYTLPNLHRPIRVNIILPITFLVVSSFLVILSFIKFPWQVGPGYAFILVGVPVYYLFVRKNKQRQWMITLCNSFNIACCKLFMAIPEESKDC